MYRFTPAHRLKKADEFSSVFIFRKVRYGQHFKIHYKPNELSHSRLGLIISKKVHKRANKRNYIKRVIRELFRREQLNWRSYDIIVRVNKCFTSDDFKIVAAEFSFLTKVFLHSKPHSNNN